MKLPKLNNIFNLEVLKFVFKFQTSLLFHFLMIFFNEPSQTTKYRTRFTSNENFALVFCSKTITQKLIRYIGCKMWNDLPFELKSDSK